MLQALIALISYLTPFVAASLKLGKQLRSRQHIGLEADSRPDHGVFNGTGRHAMISISQDLRKILTVIDWNEQAKLPPWLSPIQEGAAQGVAVVLGQSLKPDGSASQVLIDRAKHAKTLLEQKKVVKVLVCGGDPAGVGRTEAAVAFAVLREIGVPVESIIQESQSLTTAENAWFALRWIPKGTGQLYIITSDFHMPRATYIFHETFNYFYKMVEDAYVKSPEWKSETKRYPRLTIHQAAVKSFCGSDSSLNTDSDDHADINSKSLSRRALNELMYLGSSEVPDAMFGHPVHSFMYVWPVQINVTLDPENERNFNTALAQAVNVVRSLCACLAPPEKEGAEIPYPLKLPVSTRFPSGVEAKEWQKEVDTCRHTRTASLRSGVQSWRVDISIMLVLALAAILHSTAGFS
jgi:hypothetical protein